MSSKDESNDIPVLHAKSNHAIKDKEFVYVRLHNPNVSITFAINALNSYVVAYQVDAERRCYFFKEAPPNSSTLLFTESTRKVNVDLKTNYNSLGMKRREETRLGFKPLDESLDSFRRFDRNKPTDELRRALLIVIQMVAEAARFKYIEDRLEWKGFGTGFFPRGDIISYETNWNTLSKAIQNSEDGKFPVIQLENEDYSKRNVSTVAEVKNDMKLLLNMATVLSDS